MMISALELLDVSFEDGGGSDHSPDSHSHSPAKERKASKKEKIINHLHSSLNSSPLHSVVTKVVKKPLMHIDLRLPSCGKWRVTRSHKQCHDMQHSLEKEFDSLPPKQPQYPHLHNASQSIAPFKQYFQEIIRNSTIIQSRTVLAFLSIPDETLQIGDDARVLKAGALKLKGKKERWCVIKDRYLAMQERKDADRFLLAVLLDGCTVEKGRAAVADSKLDPATTFKLISKGSKAKSYLFSAPNEKERDSWVGAIEESNKMFDSSKFKVNGSLNITIVEGRSLAAKDFSLLGGRSDPFVIVRIEHQQFQTPIISRTLNPVWDSEFDFQISQHSGILFMFLYDWDMLKKPDSMGQVVLPLASIIPNKEIDMWLPVLPKRKERVKGEVRVKVRYEYTKEQEPDLQKVVFGKSLEKTVSNMDMCVDGVPKFFIAALDFIEKHAMDEQGLFRISGSHTGIKELKELVDKGKEIDFTAYINDHDTIAGFIKLYLRELPNPLLTFEKYSAFLAIVNSDSKTKVSDVIKILQTLPPAHQALLKILLAFLYRVSEHSKTNMMSVNNLAIVFGPPLLRPREETLETIYDSEAINELAALLIGNTDEIIAALTVQ